MVISSSSFTGGASRPIIRGHGGNRVRILSNGLGTQDLSNTSPDHAITIDPLMVEQVEILRGPATLLYGGAANGGANGGFGAIIRHILNKLAGKTTALMKKRGQLQRDGLLLDQLYVVVRRIIFLVPLYAASCSVALYASHHLRQNALVVQVQVNFLSLILTGAGLGILLAIHAMQSRAFHLKFPELQRGGWLGQGLELGGAVPLRCLVRDARGESGRQLHPRQAEGARSDGLGRGHQG